MKIQSIMDSLRGFKIEAMRISTSEEDEITELEILFRDPDANHAIDLKLSLAPICDATDAEVQWLNIELDRIERDDWIR